MMDHILPPLGIDVSKLTLDARLLSQHRPASARRFANSADGLTLLAQWLESQASATSTPVWKQLAPPLMPSPPSSLSAVTMAVSSILRV